MNENAARSLYHILLYMICQYKIHENEKILKDGACLRKKSNIKKQ